MAELRAALVVTCLFAACGGGSDDTGFDVSFVVRGGAEISAGGYEVELRRTNGEVISGLSTRFVPFIAGEQAARLAIDDTDVLGEAGRLSARIVARAVLQEGGAPVAYGSEEVVFEADELGQATVELFPIPELGTEAALAAYLSSSVDFRVLGDSVVVEWLEAPANEGFSYHTWASVDGELSWLGVLNATGSTEFSPEDVGLGESLVLEPNLELVVVGESADNRGELVAPTGPVLLQGAVTDGVRSVVQARLPTLSDLGTVLATAQLHAEFAAAVDTESNILDHTEHVVNILSEGAPSDLDGSGVAEDPAVDDEMISEGPLTLLDALTLGLESALNNASGRAVPVTIAAELVACEQDLRGDGDSLSVAIVTAEDYAAAAGDGDPDEIATLKATLFENLDEVLGQSREPSSGFLCVREKLERIGSFFLAPPG